jgi:hypothetical protein
MDKKAIGVTISIKGEVSQIAGQVSGKPNILPNKIIGTKKKNIPNDDMNERTEVAKISPI